MWFLPVPAAALRPVISIRALWQTHLMWTHRYSRLKGPEARSLLTFRNLHHYDIYVSSLMMNIGNHVVKIQFSVHPEFPAPPGFCHDSAWMWDHVSSADSALWEWWGTQSAVTEAQLTQLPGLALTWGWALQCSDAMTRLPWASFPEASSPVWLPAHGLDSLIFELQCQEHF